MKKTSAVCFVLMLLVNLSVFAQRTANVKDVLDKTTEVLKEVEQKVDMPQPKTVKITFQTSLTTETNAGIKILIVKLGRRWQREQSSEVTYSFGLSPTEALNKNPLKAALAKAIKDAYEQLKSVDNSRVKVQGFTVKVSFVIERSTEVSGEYELAPITPSLGRTWKKKAVHTVEIEFDSGT